MNKVIPTIEQHMTPFPYTVSPRDTLGEAHRLMRKYGVRHLPVMDEDGALVGIVTMRDLHLLETLPDIDQEEVPVEDAMTEDPYVVEPDMPLDQVAQVMADNKYGSAIVAAEGRVLGMFTTVDALRALHQVLSGGKA